MPAHRDDRDAGIDGANEIQGGTVRLSVMTDFEDVGMKIVTTAQEPPFRLSTGVAHKEHARATVLEAKDERITVDVAARTGDERASRTVEAERNAVVRLPHVATSWLENRYAVPSCDVERIAVRMARIALPAVGERARTQHAQYRSDAAGMIAERI